MSLDARLIASDVGSVTASFVRQNGQFRFLNADPTYRTTQAVQIDSRWQLDRFLPTGLGISAPFSVTHARTAVDPELLTGTDLRGGALAGLRRPLNRSTTFALALRRSVKGTNWLTRSLLDPLQAAATLTKGRSGTEYATAQSSNYNVASIPGRSSMINLP